MKTALFLLLSTTLVHAQEGAQPPKRPAPVQRDEKAIYGPTDAALKAALDAVADLENCFKTHAVLVDDLQKKRAQLSEEFKGKIPSSFNDLLTMKKKRADKQEALCLEKQGRPDALFVEAFTLLNAIDPPGLAGVTARRKKIGDSRTRYNQLLVTYGHVTPSKGGKPQPGPQQQQSGPQSGPPQP